MSLDWYLVVCALIFSIGAAGVLTRRNPLVILLCLELMLNAANLALIAFARMWGNGDGQIFAIIVMVVAACEVVHRPRPRRRACTAAACRSTSTRSGSCTARCRRAAWLVLLFPLAGTIVIALGFRVLPGRAVGRRSAPLAIAAAFVAAVVDVHRAAGPRRGGAPGRLRRLGLRRTRSASTRKLSILVDPLSVFMALVVTGVSTLIHLYSVAYMASDRGYARFFAYLNFFVFSMLVLVMAANFLLLIVGWAFVGAASYLLISFWYRRTTATTAGIKAFVINVVGDVGLVLGTFFIFRHSGTLDFLGTFDTAPRDFADARRRPHRRADPAARRRVREVRPGPAAHVAPGRDGGPDAGLRADPRRDDGHRRRLPDRAHAPAVRAVGHRGADVGAIVGCVTLLVAGTIGLVVTDLKRVIAYSTMSQIGYMIMAVSAGAYVAGLFHLMTHAFFKALLFMAAGSVIGAMAGEQSLNRMSGFREAMPFTYVCFVIGGLALAGVPPFSGFFSKDEILADDRRARRRLVGPLRRRLRRRVPHRDLHVADDLPRLLGRAVPGGARARGGPPAPRRGARSTRPTARSRTPTSASRAPSTTSPSGAVPMKAAMGALAVLAVIGGVVQVPWVDSAVDEVPRADVRRLDAAPRPQRRPHRRSASCSAPCSAWPASPSPTGSGCVQPGHERARARRASRPCTGSSSTSGTSTSSSTSSSCGRSRGSGASASRPSSACSSTALFVGGTTGIVKAGSAAVRALQYGFLRAYAALLVLGIVAVAFYFLIQSS